MMANISYISSVAFKGLVVFLIAFVIGCLLMRTGGDYQGRKIDYYFNQYPYYVQKSNSGRQHTQKEIKSKKQLLPQQQERDTWKKPTIKGKDTKNQLLKEEKYLKKQILHHETDAQKQQPQRRPNDIKTHLLHACEEMKRNNFKEFQDTKDIYQTNWIIAHQFKLMACKNLKVGSTNIARIFYTLDHLSERSDSNRVSKGRARHSVHLENKTSDEVESVVKSYTKFMYVRPPLARLLSAYRDNRPGGMFKHKHIRISFRTYLERLVATPDRNANPHVVSFTRRCNPCRANYDFIGSMDTFETDMEQILRAVGAEKLVVLPHRNQTGYGQNKTDEILQEYLKDVPKSVIQKVYEQYYWDYFLFGFPKPDF